MAYTLIGRDFVPPDVRGKVTGQAKYAEDFRAEGMLFCKLLTSPMPHARVRNIDASAALALAGVHAVLTADDIPAAQAPRSPATPILTNEPCYVGEPILAVAAVDETTAQDAIDLIELDLEPLPFTFDPLRACTPADPMPAATATWRAAGSRCRRSSGPPRTLRPSARASFHGQPDHGMGLWRCRRGL